MFCKVFLAVLGLTFASSTGAAVHAVITNCCVGSGTILEIDAANLQIERSLSTGADSAFGFSITNGLALTNDGQSAAVLSNIGMTLVNLKTGVATQPLDLPGSFYSLFPFAANPVSGIIYWVWVTCSVAVSTNSIPLQPSLALQHPLWVTCHY